MAHPSIAAVAALIADTDPALAQAFIAKPFHRKAMAEAFCAEMTKAVGQELAWRIEATLLMAIERAQEA